MGKYLIVSVVILFTMLAFGCAPKEAAVESEPPPALTTPSDVGPPAAEEEILPPAGAQELEPLPLAGEPTAQEIQRALANAGYYSGAIDGMVGPATKRAIREFQRAKGLTADGKVGPKTWAELGSYLNR